MTLEALGGGGGYDDIQNTAPTGASIGDTWLDTSVDPPIGKVYADLGSGGQWTTDLLDQEISSVGGVDWASKTLSLVQADPAATSYTINGAGYLRGFIVQFGNNSVKLQIDIDGTQVAITNKQLDGMTSKFASYQQLDTDFAVQGLTSRFESSITFKDGGANNLNIDHITVFYEAD